MGSNHIWRNQTQSSIVVWWRPLKIQGAFEFCAPMDDVLKVTAQPAEDFEVTARRYATLPKAQRTLANGVRAWFDFMRTPLSPGYTTPRATNGRWDSRYPSCQLHGNDPRGI